jgi:transcriptional regulator with XRE-family HTH domain
MTIPEILKEQRLAKRLTQKQLARKIGLESHQFIYMLEKGKSKIPLRLLGRLIKVLDLNAMELTKLLTEDFEAHLNTELTKGKNAANKRG